MSDREPLLHPALRWAFNDEYGRVFLFHHPESNSVSIYDSVTGDSIANFHWVEISRAAACGLSALVDLLKPALTDWRKRLYDYNHAAEGVYDGDLL